MNNDVVGGAWGISGAECGVRRKCVMGERGEGGGRFKRFNGADDEDAEGAISSSFACTAVGEGGRTTTMGV